ncbi:MAG: hypothetical protein ABSH38_22090 [Verrucomicrobiota bacterium]|jgi:hypothetical protein
MKIHLVTLALAAFVCPVALLAADDGSDLATVGEAQEQVLQQARQALERAGNPQVRGALETAVKDMERAKAALERAKKTPAELPAAVAAEQAAYQALLKMIPHDFQVSRSRNRSSGGHAGQPGRGQLDQLEMTSDENRYETERQAAAAPTEQQREQLQIADRLKALAQRQQDLNDRLRELQTALQEARTDAQREDIRRQLKRLQDEERQMLADVDELRQQLERSPNASSLSKAGRQLEQARSDTRRAAEEIGNESVSQALAAGTRAQQGLRDLREDMRRQTSSQFAEQMRQLRSQARDLGRQEEEIGRSLESLAHPKQKTLDDAAQRQQLIQQMARQQSALTNLVAGMENLTEQAESTEPLLSQQLYDAVRRASQMHTENLLETGAQLVDRGLLTQAAGPERAARQNIGELRQRVEHAAESVLGNETEALRYAQKELDDLAAQVEREAAGAGTNAAGQNTNATGQTTNAAGLNTNAAGQNTDAAGQNANAAGQPQPQDNPATAAGGNDAGGGDRLRQMVQQFGGAHGVGGANNGPVTGNDFASWTERVRDVEQVLDAPDRRNQLAAVRERVGAFRADFRRTGRKPDPSAVRVQVLDPMTQIRSWLREELARREDSNSLVPLDHDPVPENYSDLVRKYYEKLGGGQ